MKIEVRKCEAREVEPFRELYRHEANCQIVHDAGLRRGFADPYWIDIDGRFAGYGAVFTKHYVGRVMEFYTFPAFRTLALPMFGEMLAASQAVEIEAQTNMPLALEMLCSYATNIEPESLLFYDAWTTALPGPTERFRRRRSGETSTNGSEPEGDWVIDIDGVIVSNGGFLTHYNPPYGDVYMETAEPFRRQGFGSFLVQEIKRVCYESGKKPSARCNPTNVASQRTLERAGFRVVGQMLAGKVSRG